MFKKLKGIFNENINGRKKLLASSERGEEFLEKRHKVSRFGQKHILEVFEQGYKYLPQGRNGEEFTKNFNNWVVPDLKKKKSNLYFKGETYKNFKVLYGKYVSLRDKYGDSMFKVFNQIGGANQGSKKTKEKTKGQLTLELTFPVSNVKLETEKQIEQLKTQEFDIYKKLVDIDSQIQALQSLDIEHPEDVNMPHKVKELKKKHQKLSTQACYIHAQISKLKKQTL